MERALFLQNEGVDGYLSQSVVPVVQQAEGLLDALFLDPDEELLSSLKRYRGLEARRRLLLWAAIRVFNTFFAAATLGLITPTPVPTPMNGADIFAFTDRMRVVSNIAEGSRVPPYVEDTNATSFILSHLRATFRQEPTDGGFVLRFFDNIPVVGVPFPSITKEKYTSDESELVASLTTSGCQTFKLAVAGEAGSARNLMQQPTPPLDDEAQVPDVLKSAMCTAGLLENHSGFLPTTDNLNCAVAQPTEDRSKAAAVESSLSETQDDIQELYSTLAPLSDRQGPRSMNVARRVALIDAISTTLRLRMNTELATRAQLRDGLAELRDRVSEVGYEVQSSSSRCNDTLLLSDVLTVLDSVNIGIISSVNRLTPLENMVIEPGQTPLDDVFTQIVLEKAHGLVEELRAYLSEVRRLLICDIGAELMLFSSNHVSELLAIFQRLDDIAKLGSTADVDTSLLLMIGLHLADL